MGSGYFNAKALLEGNFKLNRHPVLKCAGNITVLLRDPVEWNEAKGYASLGRHNVTAAPFKVEQEKSNKKLSKKKLTSAAERVEGIKRD